MRNKIFEIKNIIKSEKPHIFGVSECELKKDSFDQSILKIPGYDVLFPKSWDEYGFARVSIYIEKSLQYHQVFELC